MEKLPRLVFFAVLAFSLLVVSGCGPSEPGGVINITGQSGDIIALQRVPTFVPCCSAAQGCRETASVHLNEVGFGSVDEMVDNSNYIAMSRVTGCVGFTTLPCSGATSMLCVVPLQPLARGTITLSGPGVACFGGSEDGGAVPPVGDPPPFPSPSVEICNTTTIVVEINATAVSVQAQKGIPTSALAVNLSNAIASDPTLSTLVFAVASGNQVFVRAQQEGVEFSYPWQSSCSFIDLYFSECAYRAQLSPVATLAPQE